ncbi:MAG: hypothetical protein ACREMA_16025, partial [Longimicrobiales bacterium]
CPTLLASARSSAAKPAAGCPVNVSAVAKESIGVGAEGVMDADCGAALHEYQMNNHEKSISIYL